MLCNYWRNCPVLTKFSATKFYEFNKCCLKTVSREKFFCNTSTDIQFGWGIEELGSADRPDHGVQFGQTAYVSLRMFGCIHFHLSSPMTDTRLLFHKGWLPWFLQIKNVNLSFWVFLSDVFALTLNISAVDDLSNKGIAVV